jgi:hypothetical protein
VGIDAMVVHTDAGLRMLPILEINPRVTMGRIAIALHKQTGGRGGWFFFTDAVSKAAGFDSRSSLIDAVQSCPGTAFTTDPLGAQHTLTALSVAKSWKTAQQQWCDLGLPWPEQ